MAAVTFTTEQQAIGQFIAFGRAGWSASQIEAAFDCAEGAVGRFLASSVNVRDAYFAAVSNHERWRTRLLEKALRGDGDALIVAAVLHLGQTPDRQALEALTKCTDI